MKIYDISWPISQATTEYKNKGTIQLATVKGFDVDGVRDSIITLGTHTGTHVDAPSHFLRDGKSIDMISLDRVMGRAKVIDLMTVHESISGDDLARYEINEGDIILLRTANSALGVNDPFTSHFIYLDASGARYLAEKRIKAVAIDYLGIERGDPEHTTHTTLMKADVVIIEGVRLSHVPAGDYFMICLPLAIIGLEAAPARAILMSESPD
jgi:arylformamidase